VRIFSGLDQTDYQDALRAIGSLLDANGYHDLRLWEREDGLIIQVRARDEGNAGHYQTFLLTDDDIRHLLNEAYLRRGMPGRRLLTGS